MRNRRHSIHGAEIRASLQQRSQKRSSWGSQNGATWLVTILFAFCGTLVVQTASAESGSSVRIDIKYQMKDSLGRRFNDEYFFLNVGVLNSELYLAMNFVRGDDLAAGYDAAVVSVSGGKACKRTVGKLPIVGLHIDKTFCATVQQRSAKKWDITTAESDNPGDDLYVLSRGNEDTHIISLEILDAGGCSAKLKSIGDRRVVRPGGGGLVRARLLKVVEERCRPD